MAQGRPTDYKAEYCQTAIDLMAEGASITEVAAEIGVWKSTVYEWIDKHQDFSDSIKKGVDPSEAWWERKGRKNLENKDFSYTGWYMNMKNRFKWSDRTQVDSTVTTLPPITIPDAPTE